MSTERSYPDYELVERRVVTEPAQLRAMAEPVRSTILDLLLERAASVSELAIAVDRPRSTVAYHVNVLVDAGLLRVVRTRRVRAIDERYYGRTARLFAVGAVTTPTGGPPLGDSALMAAAAEAGPAHEDDDLRAVLRHARIPADRAAEFWMRVEALAAEFAQLPRDGTEVFALVAGLYPTRHPCLPEPS